MSNDLDTLLRDDLLRPPADFARRVMEQLPLQTPPRPQRKRWRWRQLRWLAAVSGLVGGGLLGLSQLLSFVFGLWIAASEL